MVDQYVKTILTGSEELKKERAYWLTKLDSGMSVSRLLPDTGQFVSNKRGQIQFELPAELSQKILQISNHSEKGVYIFLLAGINYLVYRYTGETDILVGTPIFRKDYSEGLLNNLLFLRNQLSEIQSFKELLFDIKKTVGEADKYQNYPFTSLVDELNLMMGEKFTFNLILLLENIQNRDYIGADADADQSELLFSFKISNGRIMGTLEYTTALYHEETGNRFVKNLILFLQTVLKNPDISLAEIELLTKEEREEMISRSNIQIDYPRDRTLHQLFEEQVAKRPDKCALKLSDEEMTYRELNERANRLARYLREKGVTHETIVSIMVERSFEMMIGLLAILKAGGGYLPIDPDYPTERINYLLEDSKTNILITDQTDIAQFNFAGEVIDIKNLQLDELDSSNLTNINTPDHLAYIIYTSGSTGQPKGVMIEHKNVVRLLINEQIQFDFTEDDIWTNFHSFCFDFSVWEMYGALLYGGKLVIVPKTVAQNPEDFLEILRKEEVTVLNQTPTAFYNLNNQEIKDQRNDLQVRYIIFGGEALNPLKLMDWQKKYPKTKLINMYGITETTVHVTFKELKADDLQSNTSNIGKPIPTLNTYIMDRNLMLQPVGVPGELCVGGEGVARGYLNRSQLTAEKFVPNPYRPTEKIYRSGDLVRLLPDGEMEYLGRIDRQVKIRGYRIELGEIENRLLQYPEIKDVVVVTKGDIEEKSLVAYIVSDQKLVIKDLRNDLSKDLPEYMIPAFFIQLNIMPLTSNGKIDIKRLPDPKDSREVGYLPPTTELEKRLVAIWEQELELKRVGIDELFSEIGGDSIKAVRLVSKMNSDLKIDLRIEDLYANQQIKELASLIEDLPSGCESNLSKGLDYLQNWQRELLSDLENSVKLPVGYEDFYPLSSIQMGMAYYTNINPTEPLYHDQFFYQIRFELFDLAIFKKTFTLLMNRHSILRTKFYLKEFGEAIQVLLKNPEPDLQFIDLSTVNNIDLNKEIRTYFQDDVNRRFNFEKELLWRVRLFKLNRKGDYGLLFSCHHAILDGWSVASLTVEFVDLYHALIEDKEYQIESLRNSYKSYVALEVARNKAVGTEEFWKETLLGYTRNKLPFNISGQKLNDLPVRKIIRRRFSVDLLEELKNLAKKHKVTVREIFFSGYIYLLSLITTDRDIVTGLVTHDRPPIEDGDKILGCFLNTIPVRVKVETNQNKTALIDDVTGFITRARPHELFLADIAAMIGEKPHLHNPIFDTIFNYVNFHVLNDMKTEVNQGEEYLSALDPNEMTNTLFDLEVITTFDDLIVRIKYAPNYFTSQDIERALELYQRILENIVCSKEELLTPGKLLTADEKKKLIYEFNDTVREYPKDKAIHLLVEEQVERTPDQIAITVGEEEITYRDLNRRANQFAHLLLAAGVQAHERVGIMMNRSIELIVGMLAILKAGGAYVPLDPRYPTSRQEYILRNSRVERVVVDVDCSISGMEYIRVDDQRVASYSEKNPDRPRDPKSLAYIIYTSGSTGQPKGVMIEEHSVVNLISWVNREFAVNRDDRILFITSTCFDLSVYDIFGSLAAGATIVIARNEEIQNPTELIRLMAKEKITFWDSVPTTMNHLINTLDQVGPEFQQLDLRVVFLSGDWIPVALPERIHKYFPHTQVISLGGATEGTIWSIYYPIEKVEQNQVSIPYGRPLDNNYFYILDEQMNLVPEGVAGELYIGGVGVAHGYANDSERTHKSFVENKFLPSAQERMYKTGDLGRMMADGNIEFLGRIDHQVKIRGFRVELGEIENQLLKHDLIKEVVVIARNDQNGEKDLCAYIVSEEKIQISELKEFLAKLLPDYMVPTYFVMLAQLPLNNNGKVDRSKLPDVEISIDTGVDYLPPTTNTEVRLAKIWFDILGIQDVGIYDDFFDLGGHSLKATQLALKIGKEFEMEFPLIGIFNHPTIKELAGRIDQSEKSGYQVIEPVIRQDYYLLSSSQKRLYLVNQMNPESLHYNMFGAFVIEGDLNLEAFKAAFTAVIQRHESLRTSFHMIDGEPKQKVHDQIDFEIIEQELANGDEVNSMIHNSLRPFDLAKAPLLRVTLLKTSDQQIMVLDMHHIISDGISMSIFARDLLHLYQGIQLPEMKIQYKDYAVWQHRYFQSERMKKQKEYWLKHLENLTYTELPKKSFTSVSNSKGQSKELILTPEIFKQIERFCRERKVTKFTLLLAIFKVVLAKKINQQDITVGIPIAGRHASDLENMIGLFLNVLVIRSEVQGNSQFADYLAQTRQVVLEAHENQDYPYEELYSNLKKLSKWQPNSLFSILFNYLPFEKEDVDQNTGIQIRPYKNVNAIEANYEATLYIIEREECFVLRMVYREDLIEMSLAEEILGNIESVLETIIEDEQVRIGEIQLAHRSVVDGFSSDFDVYYD